MKILAKTVSRSMIAGLIISSSAAFSTDLDLILNVSGQIGDAPSWQDESGNTIPSTTLSFDGMLSGVADRDVDSAPSKVKLANMLEGNTSVKLTMPSNCFIGTTGVSANHVKLVVDTTERADGELFAFPSDVLTPLALRFSKAGLYGDKAGSVTCDSGKLTYTY
jgi:hypothetical protein